MIRYNSILIIVKEVPIVLLYDTPIFWHVFDKMYSGQSANLLHHNIHSDKRSQEIMVEKTFGILCVWVYIKSHHPINVCLPPIHLRLPH